MIQKDGEKKNGKIFVNFEHARVYISHEKWSRDFSNVTTIIEKINEKSFMSKLQKKNYVKLVKKEIATVFRLQNITDCERELKWAPL